jgi:uncharacterized protein
VAPVHSRRFSLRYVPAPARAAQLIGRDRMWHYTEGIRNWAPIWRHHGIRILPAPSSLWLDATGRRLPVPLFPGYDTLGTLAHIGKTGYDHTWFILTRTIIEKEFVLSGSEQNPGITGRSVRGVLGERLGSGPPAPIQAFMDKGADFVVERDLERPIERMNRLTDEPLRPGSVAAACTGIARWRARSSAAASSRAARLGARWRDSAR